MRPIASLLALTALGIATNSARPADAQSVYARRAYIAPSPIYRFGPSNLFAATGNQGMMFNFAPGFGVSNRGYFSAGFSPFVSNGVGYFATRSMAATATSGSLPAAGPNAVAAPAGITAVNTPLIPPLIPNTGRPRIFGTNLPPPGSGVNIWFPTGRGR